MNHATLQDRQRGVFVAGTDTGVGKTLASALLVRAWNAAYWKPVQSGTVEGRDSDEVARLARLNGGSVLPERWALAAPVSPHEAARREGVRIDLVDFSLPRHERPLVVEGAGGVLVPINETHLMADLMVHLGLPVVLVARTALGTINHTLLSLRELERRGLDVLGVILSGPADPASRDAILRFGKAPLLAEIPQLEAATPEALDDLASGLHFTSIFERHERALQKKHEALMLADQRHVWHPFTQHGSAEPPLAIASAHGNRIRDYEGREYLDLISSWWVNLHGHAHPHVAHAIACQAARLEQVIFAGFTHEPATRLAERLTRALPRSLSRVFFSDDGSTSVEVAIKIAIQHWHNQGQPRRRILAFEGAYHGDTFGAMAAGAQSGFFGPFAGMGPAVDFVPFPATWDDDADVDAKEAAALARLDDLLSRRCHAALIVEPLLQGASGMRFCRPKFIHEAWQRCRAANVLFICDEIMTGFFRTGTLFASEQAGIEPDLMCLSKGLTGGFLPMAITACTEALFASFADTSFAKALAHGHSFTANPLGCAAANASLDLLERPETRERIEALERVHADALPKVARECPFVSHTRIVGTMAAFDVACTDAGYEASVGPRLRRAFAETGLLLRPLGNVVYLLPPYCTTPTELSSAYERIIATLHRTLV